MKINQTADIPAPIDQVWTFLDDIPSVATCMPGAQLTGTVDETTYEGLVKVAIGPLVMNYTGTLTIDERNEAEHTVVILASGRDRRGSGTAKANVTAQLTPDNNHTRLHINSDVQLTGRVASLGRGVQDVSNKLFAEFAEQLATQLQNGETTAVNGTRATTTPTLTPASMPAEGAAAAQPAAEPAAQPPAAAANAASQAAAGQGATVKLGPLVWSVTREKLAAFLLRLSKKVSP